MDFNNSLMKLPKSSSALPSELQRPVRMHSSISSNNKIHQDEDERDPRFTQLLKENLFCFWKRQKEEILRSDPKRKHELPISRIRRAMKSNDQVKMVSAHSTVLLSKAIEMFILELTLRAWMQADQVKHRTLNRHDFARAIRDEELFDFLSDIVPLQTYKNQFQVEEANDCQGNEFYAAYQMIQPNNIPLQYQFQVEEANDVQGNKFHLANQMVQLQNNPLQQLYQFQAGGEANDGQGNEFVPAYQIVQPNDILLQYQFQVEEANDVQGNKFHLANQMVQLQNNPQLYQFQAGGEANDGQGNEFVPAYQIVQPNDILLQYQFQVEEANDVQGNKFHLANQMVQLQNNPLQQLYQFQAGGEANDGQGNEFVPAYQIVQPNDILLQCQFQGPKKGNDGQGNEFQARELKILSEALIEGFDLPAYQTVQSNNIHLPAYQMVQPNNIPVEGDADDGKDNEFHPAYQMVQSDNIPCQFQVQKKANDGQGNEFQARELKILLEALTKGFDLPAYQMVQPNNIPNLPAYQMVQPNNIPCQYQVQEANDGQGNELHPAYQLVQPNNIPFQFQVQKKANDGQGNEFQARELKILLEALVRGFDFPTYQMVQPNNIPDLPAYQMVQPNNIPCQYQVQEANDGQGNELHPAYQLVQPNNIPLQFQFQVQKKANDGQGNEFQARKLKILLEALIRGFDFPAYQMVQPNNIPDHPAYQMVQPNIIPCQYQVQEANDGQGNELQPAYQLVQPNNIPCQFQVQKKANDGQGNEFPARELKILSEALTKGFDFSTYQLVQPNNIPDLPAYQMVQPNIIPCQYQVQEANDGQGNELHPAYQLVQPNNIPASFISTQGIPAPVMPSPLINLSPEAEFNVDDFLMDYEEGDVN
ncbi:uncharacterized protein LOC129872842 isoform X3 [Solanum dulcamara]|uniref:uncharacterized protein LOC129872842 isoform X3 n=1 Tax=Solanum dulcamara TaxID=45834 RepID=UPI002485C6F4|nr:uncharacterized protein LOC129872842 isoform X3 [Solanum dulcamara]